MRVALYARVSTSHHDQNPEVQIQELRRYCAARDWNIAHEIVDHGFSGGTDVRPGLKQLMALVKAREVDALVVLKLDRLFRSLKHLVTALEEFDALGVQFVAIKDQLDMTTASGRLMLHIVAAFGEFERGLIRERTILGLDHARRRGKKLGRPRLHDADAIRRLRARGLSYRAIHRELGVPMGTITRALRSGL